MRIKLTFIFLFALSHVIAQQAGISSVSGGLRNTTSLTEADAEAFNSIEKIVLPERYRSMSLPDSLDNSNYEWFRPIFSQTVYPNCMQSTSIAYNFTYEINRLRNLPASDSNNQYPTHFAWNFFNGGNGWYGVNYLFTMDVLKHHGTPSVADYGGFYYGEGERWMSGYDEWYNAMNNRMSKVRSIYVGDETGLLTLKHWLNDHLDGSETGGVASFIACSPYGYQSLPPESPHTGKKVMVGWCNEPLHGMTIVGYNDSICFDYNGDGLFTNHIDLNDDGIINLKDWEIGAMKFANSYGDNFADDGYCFMMYKTLADDIQEGGIWLNTVHVIDAKEEHDTRMTYKVSLGHNYRGRIRVQAGVSSDAGATSPEHVLSFTIFNYQGGWHYMQGNDDNPDNKTIEFGLDVTPLLAFVEPGQPCKFFLIVDERDEENFGTGQVNSFSLMDYADGLTEIPCEMQIIPLLENGTTMLSVIHSPVFDKVFISTEELPVYESGQAVEMQMTAQGGQQPYTWSLDKNYRMNFVQADFPMVEQEQLMTSSLTDSLVTKKLDFSFPFYGHTYDSVILSSSGYLYFDNNMVFWSYLVDMAYFLRNNRVLAPFLCQDMMVHPAYDNGIWYEGDDTKASFRWKTTLASQPGNSVFNFALHLYPDGNIDLFFGEMEMPDEVRSISGIADGDNMNYSLPELPMPADIIPGTKVEFIAPELPSGLDITDQGWLTLAQNTSSAIKDVGINVIDNTLLGASKIFQFTDGPEIMLEVDNSAQNTVMNGQVTSFGLVFKNRRNSPLSDIDLVLDCDHPLVNMHDYQYHIESIQPGQTHEVSGVFSCIADKALPDRQNIIFELSASTSGGVYEKEFYIISSAPSLALHGFAILNQGGLLEPGGNADLEISLINNGSRKSINTIAVLNCVDPGITIHNPELDFGDIAAGGLESVLVNISADHSISFGREVSFSLSIQDEFGLEHEMDFSFRVGKVPVCVIDLDPLRHSGPNIFALLQQMGVEASYTRIFPGSLLNFQSVIICLGIQFSYHEVTWNEHLIMEEYLDHGGNIYMESRVHWNLEDNYAIFDRFNIDTEAYPGLYEILDGVDSTFTEGLSYANIATQPFSYFRLKPVPPAYSIFTGRTYPYCAAVAFDAGTYKTIGTLFELGALIPSDTCQLVTFMEEVLDFFGIVQSSLDIYETDIDNEKGVVYNYPNPFTHITRISLKISGNSLVKAAVYDLQGRQVKEWYNGVILGSGTYKLVWDGNNASGRPVPGGIYIYRLTIDGIIHAGKMILTR